MVFRWVLEVLADLFRFAPLHSYPVETVLSFESEYMQIHLNSAEKSNRFVPRRLPDHLSVKYILEARNCLLSCLMHPFSLTVRGDIVQSWANRKHICSLRRNPTQPHYIESRIEIVTSCIEPRLSTTEHRVDIPLARF
jgi:hypothetical protein